jgi:hypothetical protein
MGVGIKSAEAERKSRRVSRRLGKSMTATVIELAAAREAFRRYGKGRHRAALNFGDCCAYGLAKMRSPAPRQRNDFALTDVKRALWTTGQGDALLPDAEDVGHLFVLAQAMRDRLCQLGLSRLKTPLSSS